MEGRWTIRLDHAGNELAPAQPEPSDQFVPVVPCDDAAIERVAAFLHRRDDVEAFSLRDRAYTDPFRKLARDIFAVAAGETP